MEQMEFNLLDEPWIRVMTEDCTVVERSLMQVLLNSHRYQRLAGELPTQDVALLRLLLAILQTVFYRVDPEGEDDPIEDRAAAIRRWQALWNAGRFPVQPIRTYLEIWKDRFWLFHPEHPFYQVPAAAVGTKFKASKLNGELSESAHKMRLFPLRDGEEKETLSYAEAARWLVTLIGFDDSASTKKETGTGTGWLGDRVNVYAIGENLFETLILNLVFLKDGRYVWAENMPAWEQPTMTTAKKREIPLPDNQAELLTLQSRRLILSREENRVTGFSSTGGDFFGKEGRVNAFSEQMTLWRAGKTPKNAVPQFVPAPVDPWRQMWRDFEVILGRREDTHIPGVVAWLTELRRKNVIPRKYVHITSVGVTYDSKKGSIADIVSDHLDFQMSLLDAAGELWIVLVGGEIHLIDKVARALGALAEGLYLAQGGQLNGAGKKARQSQRDEGMRLLYAAVDLPFREWLAHIGAQHEDDENTRAQEQQCWRSIVFRIADNLGREMVRDAGTAAFTGRWIVNEMAETNGRFFTKTNGERKSVFYSSPTEYNRYLNNLKSLLKNAAE
ncbi:MAG: type I-E CRISPR-associated protein Cse1/CasA [Oscillospiraceae bacterium]|nr:type I-E CRISPR-associated protein Cse1/CasA [Oscillospiraceae bacterium]